MRDRPSPIGTRGLLLRSLAVEPSAGVLPEGALPEGVYDPVRDERRLLLPGDAASHLATMASFHEGCHAFLNASTSYGNAMLLMGALANAGHGRFRKTIARMIDDCVDTHETYATVAALQLVSEETERPKLLAGYPAYHRYLRAFLDRFDGAARPTIGVMALRTCARAAMQTPVYEFLRSEPCERWSDYAAPVRDAPDERFAVFDDPRHTRRVLDALDAALRSAGEPLSRLVLPTASPDDWAAAFMTERTRLATVEHRAYAVAAELLRNAGFEVLGFDDQRSGLSLLVDRTRAASGNDVTGAYSIPSTVDEDYQAVYADYRRESLFLAESKVGASVFDGSRPDDPALQDFIYRNDDRRHVQLVAMPADKALALYDVRRGAPLLTDRRDGVVTALRRMIRDADDAPHVEALLVTPAVLKDFVETNAPVDVLAVASLVATRDQAWRDEWVVEDGGGPDTSFVLVDDDPFAHLEYLAGRAGRVHLVRFGGAFEGREFPHPVKVPAVGFVAADEPDIFYFTPCSAPLLLAILKYAEERLPNVEVAPAFPARWAHGMQRVLIHVVTEERRFGAAFWT